MKKTTKTLFTTIVCVALLFQISNSWAQAPSITSFTPSSGTPGTLVSVTGNNMGSPTAFTIGGATAIVISNTGTSLVGMVMPGSSTGTISISTANGTGTSSGTFTVTATPYPSAQQGSKLVGTGAVGTPVYQGNYVSISADGNTAIVAGNNDNSKGAIWVYTRSGGTWTQQGTKLVGTGAVGNARQGYSVSLSADGNTVIVGGFADNTNAGAAWVFTRSGSTWTQQGSKLVGTGAVGAATQGRSVSLSADGNTAMVGGDGDNTNAGAAWVFTRSGSTWTQQGSKMVGTGAVGAASQGGSVSLSADGNTAMVCGTADNTNAGAAWVYTRSGSTWTQQGSKLVGTGAVGAARLGQSVSLSADGNTALVGGRFDNSNTGAAWVFTRTGSTWTQQGSKLVGTGAVGAATQGFSVSLSADGNTAMVGGNGDNSAVGAVWVYTRSGSTWTQQGSKLVGTGAVGTTVQGTSVSLSADGNTAIVGGYGDNSNAGAAWVYVVPDTITYNGNSHTGGSVPAVTTGANGASVILASNSGSLTRTGYTFGGWNTLANGTGTSYAAGASYTLSGDITLYAQWTANSLTVTYDSQGGSAISNGSTTTGGTVSSPGTPTRAGYTFNGWFVASSGGSAISFPYAHGQTADFTLYAQWTANTLTVTYNSQAGSAISSGTTTTGGTVSNPGSPTRAGYTFNGWFVASSGGSAISFPYTHGQTADFTLFAQWKVNNPTGIISGHASICSGTSTQLSLALTGQGPWSGTLSDGTPFSGTENPLMLSVTPIGNTTYTIATLSDAGSTAAATDLSGSAVVTVTPSATNIILASACGSYNWNEFEYTTSGLYVGTTTNCITEKLDLTITPLTNHTTTIYTCTSYTWTAGDGQTYTSSGNYTYTTGCHTEELDLTITPSIMYYVDNDHDGYGSNNTALLCEAAPPFGYATNSLDCNDADATQYATLNITAQPDPTASVCLTAGTVTLSASVASPIVVPINYVWQVQTAAQSGTTWNNIVNNTIYSGATTASLVITAATAIMSGNKYRLVASSSNACSTVLSNTAVLTVNPKSVAGTISGATTLCNGSSTQLILSNNVGTVQWQSASASSGLYVAINSANSTTYTTPNLTAVTYYKAVVTSGTCASATTAAATIAVSPISVAGVINGAGTTCSGVAKTLTLSGNIGTIVQWESSSDGTDGSWTVIAGTTTATYSATVTSDTYFRVFVKSGACSSVATTPVLIDVVSNPVAGAITPNNAVICSGTNTILTVSNSVGGIQWQSSTTLAGTYSNISGAIAVSYTTPNLTATRYYKAVVSVGTGTCGAPVETTPIAVTVIKSVAGTVSGGGVVCINSPKIITLAGHTGTIEWQVSDSASGTFTTINGETGTSYSVPTNNEGTYYYRALVTNGACVPVATTVVSVTIRPAVISGTISGTQNICIGASSGNVITFNNNTAGATIQWQSSTTLTGSYTNIVGATAATYTILTTTAGTKFYKAVVRNGACVATTDAYGVAINPVSISGTISGAGNICIGGVKTLTLAGAVGVIQWESSANNTDWTPIVGATANTYSIPTITAGTFYYHALVTSGACNVASTASATVVVNSLSVAGTISGPVAVCINATTNRTLTLSNYVGTIQWQSSATLTGTYANITSATSANYDVVTATAGTKYYRAVVTSGACSVSNSAGFGVTINPISIAGNISGDTKFIYNTAQGKSIGQIPSSFSVNGEFTFETWIKFPANTISNWGNIFHIGNADGQRCLAIFSYPNSRQLQIRMGSNTDWNFGYDPTFIPLANTWYMLQCVVTNTSRSVYINGILQGSVSANGITWAPTGTNIYASNPWYTSAGVQLRETRLWNVARTSSQLLNDMYLIEPPQSNLVFHYEGTDSDGSACVGTTKTLTLTGSVGTIQWESSVNSMDWAPIFGAIASTYSVPTATAGTTYYRAVLTSGACTVATTATAIVVVNPLSVSGTISGSTNICINSTSGRTLTVSDYIGTAIQWQSSATLTGTYINITGATSANYDVVTVTAGTKYYRAVITSGACSASTTTAYGVTINPVSVSGTISGAGSVCMGGTKTLTLAGSVGAIQWQTSTDTTVGLTPIASATATTYIVPTATAGTTYYRAVLTSGACTVATTATAIVVVNPLSVSGTISGSTNICINSTSGRTLTVSDYIGTAIQWQSSATLTGTYANIAGATMATYDVVTTTAGTKFYKAVITSGACSASTTTAYGVTINPVSVSGTISGAGSVCMGGTKTLTLAGSVGAIQWQNSTDTTVGWTLIASATATTYSVPTATAGTTYYRAVLTSGACTVATTATAIVVVNPLSVSGTISGSTNICINSTSGRTLTVSNYIGTAIQWQSAATLTGTYANIAAARSATYDVATTTVGTKYYRAIVTSGACSASTSVAYGVTINPLSVAGTITGGGGLCTFGSNVALGKPTSQSSTPDGVSVSSRAVNGITSGSIVSSTSTGVDYQAWWQLDLQSITNISIIRLHNISISTDNGSSLRNFYIITSPLPFASQDLQTTLNDSNVSFTYVTTYPNPRANYAINRSARYVRIQLSTTDMLRLAEVEVYSPSKKLTLTGAVGGIQWESSDNNTNWTPIVGATATNYNAPTTTAGTFYYRAVTTSGACSAATTATATVVVVPNEVAGTISVDSCSGSLILSNYVGNIQWFVEEEGSRGNYDDLQEGYTSAVFPYFVLFGTQIKRVIAKVTSCYTTSTEIVTFGLDLPNVGVISGPSNISVHETLNRTLTVAATGIFQWESSVDGTYWSQIVSATGTSNRSTVTYTVPTEIADTGTRFYRVVVKIGSCSVVSTPFTVVVYPNPAGFISGPTTSICSSATSGRTLLLSDYNGAIQWQSSASLLGTYTDIAGATNANYDDINNTAGTYFYRAMVTNGDGVFYSPSYKVIINPVPIAGVITGAGSVCAGTFKKLTLNGSVGSVQWESSPNGISDWIPVQLTLITNSVYSVPTNIAGTFYYRVVVTSGVCAPVITPVVAVEVRPTAVAGIISGASEICRFDTTTQGTLSLAGYSGSIQWYVGEWINKRGVITVDKKLKIAGATSSTFDVANFTVPSYYDSYATCPDLNNPTYCFTNYRLAFYVVVLNTGSSCAVQTSVKYLRFITDCYGATTNNARVNTNFDVINPTEETMDVMVYPNPTINAYQMFVKSSKLSQIVKARVLDIQGRLVKTFTFKSNETITFGNELKAGVYMVEVSEGDKVKTVRVVKY